MKVFAPPKDVFVKRCVRKNYLSLYAGTPDKVAKMVCGKFYDAALILERAVAAATEYGATDTAASEAQTKILYDIIHGEFWLGG